MVTSQNLCPPWTYLKDNNSDYICGDSINGIVLCNDTDIRYTNWCESFDSSIAQPSVCLLTCHCMLCCEKFNMHNSHLRVSLPPYKLRLHSDSRLYRDKLNTTCTVAQSYN